VDVPLKHDDLFEVLDLSTRASWVLRLIERVRLEP
jgi:hypothetical protein